MPFTANLQERFQLPTGTGLRFTPSTADHFLVWNGRTLQLLQLLVQTFKEALGEIFVPFETCHELQDRALLLGLQDPQVQQVPAPRQVGPTSPVLAQQLQACGWLLGRPPGVQEVHVLKLALRVEQVAVDVRGQLFVGQRPLQPSALGNLARSAPCLRERAPSGGAHVWARRREHAIGTLAPGLRPTKASVPDFLFKLRTPTGIHRECPRGLTRPPRKVNRHGTDNRAVGKRARFEGLVPSEPRETVLFPCGIEQQANQVSSMGLVQLNAIQTPAPAGFGSAR